MKTTTLFLTLLSLVFFTACDDEHFGIKGEGPVVEENRTVPQYDAVELAISGTVVLLQGPQEEIRILGQENILNNLETYVQSGKLKIKFDKNVRRHEHVTIYLTNPNFNSLILSGSGEFRSQNQLTSAAMDVTISGSGEVDLDIATAQLNTAISGSGKSRYRGTATRQTATVSGSGHVEAFDLQTERTTVQVSGSGDVEVWVTEALDVRISGSGDVTYKGTPAVNSQISGSGKVNRLQ